MMLALCMPRYSIAFGAMSLAPRLAAKRFLSGPCTRPLGPPWTLAQHSAAPRKLSTRPTMTAASQDEVIGEAKDVSSFQPKSSFIKVMMERGFIHSCTDIGELDKKMEAGQVTAYLGFDATASSLHVGSLLQIMILRHLQQCGHKPIILLGGGTTKVGDPSGKDASRKMLSNEDIASNIKGIQQAFYKFITFGNGHTDATLVNNDDWLSAVKYLEFLRDYGPMFTINRMLNFESVKLRLERENPLTFLEFNYMILQAYDFLELNRRFKCTLQLGGSDQWGNMVNGVELCRRVEQKQVFALTAPLIKTADGKKMGKSEGGAIWLNSDLLSPYDYWQFWRNTDDRDVVRFLKLFTDLSLERIEELGQLEGAAVNEAKKVLADEATLMLHGADVLPSIHETAASLFAGKSGSLDDLPKILLSRDEVQEGVGIVDLYVKLGFASSKTDCRKLIQSGAAKVNDEKIADANLRLTAKDLAAPIKLSMGKKKHGLVALH